MPAGRQGFSLVEILISLALVAIFLPAIGIIFSFSLSSSSQGEKFTQAYGLAQEGMEEIFSQKSSWDWTTTIPTPTPASLLPFTRTIEIKDVQRCAIDICPTGTPDPTSRRIIVSVIWPENGQNQEVKLEAYVTQH